MNIAKTKVMVVGNTPINVNNVLIENAPGYVYHRCQHQRAKIGTVRTKKRKKRELIFFSPPFYKHRPKHGNLVLRNTQFQNHLCPCNDIMLPTSHGQLPLPSTGSWLPSRLRPLDAEQSA